MHCTKIAAQVGALLKEKSLKLATAESCTAGLIAAKLTDIAGSSAWFERGFVTYSNASKHEMLGVYRTSIEQFGAVSETVVMQMAKGALRHSHADIAISVSGIAGPAGGSTDKPVGLVWFGLAIKNKNMCTFRKVFSGNREKIREQAVIFALNQVLAQLK